MQSARSGELLKWPPNQLDGRPIGGYQLGHCGGDAASVESAACGSLANWTQVARERR